MAANRAKYKLVNTANYSKSTLQNIGSKKPELSIVGSEIGKNHGSTKKVFL